MYKFLIGFAVGLFVGWVIGILSAPQAGKDTLDDLGERAIELRDRAREHVEQMREELRPHA